MPTHRKGDKALDVCGLIANSRSILVQAIEEVKEGVRCQGSPDDSIVWVSREGSSFETGHYDRAVDNESIIETGACPLWYLSNLLPHWCCGPGRVGWGDTGRRQATAWPGQAAGSVARAIVEAFVGATPSGQLGT